MEMCNANYFESIGNAQYFLGHIGWTIIFSSLEVLFIWIYLFCFGCIVYIVGDGRLNISRHPKLRYWKLLCLLIICVSNIIVIIFNYLYLSWFDKVFTDCSDSSEIYKLFDSSSQIVIYYFIFQCGIIPLICCMEIVDKCLL